MDAPSGSFVLLPYLFSAILLLIASMTSSKVISSRTSPVRSKLATNTFGSGANTARS